MDRRVVITGFGVVSSIGIGIEDFWNSLVCGKSGIAKITQFDATGFDSQIAGEAKNFVPPAFFSSKDVKRNARFVQFALKASEEAILQSQLNIEKIDPYRIGVIVGSGVGSFRTIETEHLEFLQKGPHKVSPFFIPKSITNVAAGGIAIQFKFKGINFCTVTACASGAHAIGEAYWVIKRGTTDVMVAGGTEAAITPLGVGGFCALKALSTCNDDPQRASRPFDLKRDGFVMSEGAGIVVLEELEHAKKRGAPILGELCGYGATCDAYHITAPDPTGEAPVKAMEFALKEARFDSTQNLYINAHGTSTKLNDIMETTTIKKVFNNQLKNVYISSTKSMMGHTLGAAGAIEFIVSCLAVKNKIIPPTINYENVDPECDLDYTPNKSKEVQVKFACSNSFGFGGHNATLVVKEINK